MELKDCNLCRERHYGTGPVPGCGNVALAEICLLGRNPGVEEDPVKRPFVGRAGGKLNEGLVIAKCPRRLCYVTNVGKCMTPTNVNPTQQCLRICSDTWLTDELVALPKLKLVVSLGNQALHYFEKLGTVGELHGTVLPVAAGRIPGKEDVSVFVSYHPSAALRSTAMNKHFMNDMTRLGQYLRKHNLVTVEVGGK